MTWCSWNRNQIVPISIRQHPPRQIPLRRKGQSTMRTFRSGLAAAACFLCSAASVLAQEAKRPITFEDMIQLHRVGDPKISSDGKWVAYVVATPDMNANRNASNLWIVPTSGGLPLQLTQSGHDSSPEWSPDAKTLAFLSSREGTSQVYLLPMDGGEAHAIPHLS